MLSTLVHVVSTLFLLKLTGFSATENSVSFLLEANTRENRDVTSAISFPETSSFSRKGATLASCQLTGPRWCAPHLATDNSTSFGNRGKASRASVF